MKNEGVKNVSQTQNVLKEITVHVISVLVVDLNCCLLFVRLVSLLLSAQRCLICLITVNCAH